MSVVRCNELRSYTCSYVQALWWQGEWVSPKKGKSTWWLFYLTVKMPWSTKFSHFCKNGLRKHSSWPPSQSNHVPRLPLLSGLVSSPDTKSFTCVLRPCWKIGSGHVHMVKLGRNHTSILACCQTNQIVQVKKLRYANSQLANVLVPKQMLLVVDNVINTYNYLIYWPPYVNLPQLL